MIKLVTVVRVCGLTLRGGLVAGLALSLDGFPLWSFSWWVLIAALGVFCAQALDVALGWVDKSPPTDRTTQEAKG